MARKRKYKMGKSVDSRRNEQIENEEKRVDGPKTVQLMMRLDAHCMKMSQSKWNEFRAVVRMTDGINWGEIYKITKKYLHKREK